MRETLKIAVKDAISFEYNIPDKSHDIQKSSLTTDKDVCFSNDKWEDISRIIYNGIVEFAVNEYEIDYEKLELEQRKVIARKMRYDESATDQTKLTYGFYGEVLLDLILRCFLKTNVLLARGYLYSPIENSEVKGFDAFHLVEKDNALDLWLGEAKFYQRFKKPITDVLEKINLSLSDKYVNRNLLAIIDWQDRFTTSNDKLKTVLDSWETNPDINLSQELKKYGIRVTYPIFIGYEKNKSDSIAESIKSCIKHINDEFNRIGIVVPASFEYRLFFIFLPLSEVKKIKQEVIQWIESKEPLI